VIIVPLAFATVVTVTASMYKIFSSVPAIGYWAQHSAFRNALARGETSFGTAKNVEAMEAVVRNTFIQGTLSIIFVTLTVIVIGAALIATIRSLRAGGRRSAEDQPVPSRIYAPSGFISMPAERELEKEWAQKVPPRVRSHH
jgi:carbon starvation protein